MGENVPGISLGKFDFSPVCHGCGYPAAKTQSLDALGHVWHHDCFRCKDCNCELTSWYFERDGDLYCKDHYRLRFHEVCNKCMGVTVGPVMVVGEHIYHPECFACMQCGSFIGVEESYILVERSKLYCEECSKSQYSIEKKCKTYEQESLKSSTMKPKHRHLIKLMEFPIPTSSPSALPSSSSSSNSPSTNLPVQFHFMKRKSLGINNQNKDLNYLQVIRTNTELLNENNSALQVGDKILEVNGEPIQDSSIEDIENMIKKMQKILVTVERSDSPLRSSNSPNILLSPQSIQTRNYGFNSNDSNSPIQNHYQNNSNYISKNNLSSSDSQNVKTASSNLHKNEILPSFIHNGVCEKQSKDYCYNNGGTYKSQASIVLKKASVAKRISRRVQNINHLNNVINNVALNANKTIVDEKSIDNGFEKSDETPSLMPRLRTNPFQRSDAIGSFISGANHDGVKSPSLTYRHSIASPKLDSSPSRVPYLRCNSVKAESRHKIFRPCDLIRGELLGKGFFGQVIKVTHKVTNEVMVLKELFRYDKEAHLNFTKEVSVLRTLNHPNLLRFIGVLYMDKKLNIVTEYISGGTLKSKIQDSNEVLSWPRRIQMIQDIAEAMAYLHSRNIIHRDLNSQNCLLKEDGSVVVADFGLARVIPKVCPANHDPIKANNVTSSDTDHTDSQGETACNVAENSNQMMGRKHSVRGGVIKRTINRRQKNKGRRQKRRYTVVGNPYWMAPEMMKGLKYDEKVDVFSFGIVTCEVIGRVQADPDFLPRTSEFGLHIQEFWDKFGGDCPKFFFNIAVLSCQINPEARPSFEDIQMWLVDLAPLGSTSSVLPPPLDFDPTSFSSSPAVDLDSEESN